MPTACTLTLMQQFAAVLSQAEKWLSVNDAALQLPSKKGSPQILRPAIRGLWKRWRVPSAMTKGIYCNNNFDESVLVVIRGSRTMAKQQQKAFIASADGQLTEKSASKRKCGSENARYCMRAQTLSFAQSLCCPHRVPRYRKWRISGATLNIVVFVL